MMVNEWYTAAMVLQGMMKRQRQHVESIDALAAWLGISVRLTKLHCKRYHRCIGRLAWYIGQADQTSLQTHIGRLAWHIGQADQTSLQTQSSMHW
jgi:hypothetical protein